MGEDDASGRQRNYTTTGCVGPVGAGEDGCAGTRAVDQGRAARPIPRHFRWASFAPGAPVRMSWKVSYGVKPNSLHASRRSACRCRSAPGGRRHRCQG